MIGLNMHEPGQQGLSCDCIRNANAASSSKDGVEP